MSHMSNATHYFSKKLQYLQDSRNKLAELSHKNPDTSIRVITIKSLDSSLMNKQHKVAQTHKQTNHFSAETIQI